MRHFIILGFQQPVHSVLWELVTLFRETCFTMAMLFRNLVLQCVALPQLLYVLVLLNFQPPGVGKI